MLRFLSVASVALVASLAAGSARAIDPFFPTFGNNGIDVVHYGLNLDVTPDTGRVEAEASLFIIAEKRLTSFTLDLHGLDRVECEDLGGSGCIQPDRRQARHNTALAHPAGCRVPARRRLFRRPADDPGSDGPRRPAIPARLVQIRERLLRRERAGRRLDLLPRQRRADRQGAPSRSPLQSPPGISAWPTAS